VTNKNGIKIELHGCGYNRTVTPFRHEPKLTLPTTILGTWGLDVRFFDSWPKRF